MSSRPCTDGTFSSPVLFLSLIGIAVAIAYANTLGHDFVWLDQTEIVEGGYRILSKEDARSVWLTSLDEYQFRNHGGVRAGSGYWRPVYALSITADWALFGDNPFWYHLENVLLHGLCCISLFLLGVRLLPESRDAVLVAGLATLLFAVHPLGTQSVTWISGRKDLLCSLFGVWTLLAGLSGLQSRRPGVRFVGVAVSLVSWLLAAGCKELALVVPAIATTIVVATRGSDRLPSFREGLVWLAVLWCGAGGLWLFRASIGLTGLNAAWPSESLATNLVTLSALWWHFVLRVFWPFPPMLSDRWMLVEGSAAAWLAVLAIPLIVLLCGWWIWKRRVPALALAWYLIWMLPASGLVPLRHWRAERYLYPASWGLLLLAVWLSRTWIPQKQVRVSRLVAGIWMLAAGGLATTTVLENRFWKDDLTLFSHAVEQDPLYVEGHTALAAAWLEQEEAEAAVRHSVLADRARRTPDTLSYCSPLILHANWGHALYGLGRIDEAEQQFGRALRIQPDNALMHYHLGVCELAGDATPAGLKRAQQHFLAAVDRDPENAPAIGNLGFVEMQLGQFADAVRILQPLIEAGNASTTDLRNYGSANLAIVLQQRQSSRFAGGSPVSLQRAEAAFEQLASGPDALAHDCAKLAWVRHLSGNEKGAEAALEQGRRLDSDDRLLQQIGVRIRRSRR